MQEPSTTTPNAMSRKQSVSQIDRSLTSLHHLRNHPHQSPILQSSRHPFLISQLLVDLISRTMGTFFDAHVDPETRGKRLLQSHAHPQAYDGS